MICRSMLEEDRTNEAPVFAKKPRKAGFRGGFVVRVSQDGHPIEGGTVERRGFMLLDSGPWLGDPHTTWDLGT